jgi:hypothetical protein
MSGLIRALLRLLGYRIEYVCEWGVYDCRYDGLDWHMGRPIHPGMSVAPPWAARRWAKSQPSPKEPT